MDKNSRLADSDELEVNLEQNELWDSTLLAEPESSTSPTKKMRRKDVILTERLDGYTVMSVRLRNAEFLEFSNQVEAAGLKNNRAMRIAARRIAGFLELDPASQETLRSISNEIRSIARDINQIKANAVETKKIDMDAFMAERTRLGQEIAKIEGQTQTILSVSARRHDGLKLLEEANS